MGNALCVYKKDAWSNEDSDKQVRLKMLIKYLNVSGKKSPKSRLFEISEFSDNSLGQIEEEWTGDYKVTEEEDLAFAAEL